MRILILGGGAREHALAWTLQQNAANEVICAPGNAGIARATRALPLDPTDPHAALALAAHERVDLTIAGPEAPLAAGVADLFAKSGRRLFGPTRAAARLETSKAFAKDFMHRHGVPTARYVVCDSADEAMRTIRGGTLGSRLVVKADGLAAGKGVVVADTLLEAEQAVAAAMVQQRFGHAGLRLVLEERLTGPEVSFFVLSDGARAVVLPPAHDHKRLLDGDDGPNTGGMGAYSPSPLLSPALSAAIERDVIAPVLAGMSAEGTPFRGFLYAGLMLTADGPKVIEFNVRFGDPEAQVVLPAIEDPLADLLWAAADGALPTTACTVNPDARVGVVLAARGYPDEVERGQVIRGLDVVERECPDASVFFAGVRSDGEDLVTAGGRVLTVTGRAATLDAAIDCAYAAVSRITFDGMHYRRDIGRKGLLTGPQPGAAPATAADR